MKDDIEKVKQGIKNCINPECSCNGCEYNEYGCDEQLMFDALSVIDKLQAEIERLTGYINGFSKNAIIPVRCKDCQHQDDLQYEVGGKFVCRKGHGWNPNDFFCADGEPRKQKEGYGE